MRKRILTLLTAFTFATSLFVGNLADPNIASATCTDARIVLYRDQGFQGGSHVICYPNDAIDLNWYNFDNVTSSLKYFETINVRACVYKGLYYTGETLGFVSNGQTASWNWWDSWNDRISSVKWYAQQHAC